MSRLLVGALAALAALAPARAPAGERRVAPGGACSDLGPGSPSRPWCTLAAAARRAEPGDRVRIAAGVWHGPLSIQVSGLPGRPIVFEGERAILDGRGQPSTPVELLRRSHIVIRQLTVRGALRVARATDVRIEQVRAEGIRCERSSRVQLVTNRIDGPAGIELAAPEDFLVAGNRLTGGGGIKTLLGPLRGELRENEVRGARDAGILLRRPRLVRVIRNRLHECRAGIRVVVDDEEGPALRASHDNEIVQNLVGGSQTVGVELRRGGGASLVGIRVYHNLIRGSGGDALLVEGALSTTVANNIFSANRGTIAGSTVSSSTITHNLFHANRGPAIGRAALSADPAFRAPTRGDFRLRRGSPAVDAGTLVGLPYVGRAPDLGPFERTE